MGWRRVVLAAGWIAVTICGGLETQAPTARAAELRSYGTTPSVVLPQQRQLQMPQRPTPIQLCDSFYDRSLRNLGASKRAELKKQYEQSAIRYFKADDMARARYFRCLASRL